jgi:hypothetical protein
MVGTIASANSQNRMMSNKWYGFDRSEQRCMMDAMHQITHAHQHASVQLRVILLVETQWGFDIEVN